jgi:GH24 family phage-related lysozyme (muramidase)
MTAITTDSSTAANISALNGVLTVQLLTVTSFASNLGSGKLGCSTLPRTAGADTKAGRQVGR